MITLYFYLWNDYTVSERGLLQFQGNLFNFVVYNP